MPEGVLDEVDESLIAALMNDCRATNRALAHAIGVNEQTIASRIRRLLDNDLMQVVSVVSQAAHGYHRRAHFGAVAGGRPLREIAEELAATPEVIMLAASFGRFQFIGVLVARDDAHLYELVADQIGSIDGIEDIEFFLDLEHIVYNSGALKLRTNQPANDIIPIPIGTPPYNLDEIDVALIREFMGDGRASFREVARRLSASESMVRNRVKFLEENQLLKFQVVKIIPEAISGYCSVYLAFKIDGSALRSVATYLSALEGCGHLVATFGSVNLLCAFGGHNRSAVTDKIFNEIALLEGVRSMDVWEVVEVYKHEHRLLPRFLTDRRDSSHIPA
jgi:Lrp/AsnC family transcriptional regulator for asnA, asnC and gidA